MRQRALSTDAATQPLTDSVWFWVALFALTGILLTWATSSRALDRRSQLVGRFYARQLSGLSVPNPDVAAQQPADPRVAMGGSRVFIPIYAVLMVMLSIAIVQLVRHRAGRQPIVDRAAVADRDPITPRSPPG